MKNENISKLLRTAIRDIDSWRYAISIDYEPADNYMSLKIEQLNTLRAMGLITYKYDNFARGVSTISLTDKGQTYFINKRDDRKRWIARGFIAPIISSILTAIVTTLITYWIIGR